ncbi:hypothetical protein AK88_05575, partial [Plasmodium fragile]
EKLWDDIETELKAFIRYITEQNTEGWDENCENVYYKHPKNPNGPEVKVTRAGERIMCRLMVGALYFMNENSWTMSGRSRGVSNDDDLKEYVRCAIVNMYMEILKESSCEGAWGLWYAWYTMKQMEEGLKGGLITRAKCGHGVLQNIQTEEFDMAQKIQAWLKKNKTLTDKIARPEIQSICNKKLEELGAATEGTHAMLDKIQLQTQEKTLIQKLGQELKNIVEEVQTEVLQWARDHGASINPSGEDPSKGPAHDDTEAKAPNSVKSDKPEESGKVDGKEPPKPATTTTETATPQEPPAKDRWEKAPIRHAHQHGSTRPARMTRTPPYCRIWMPPQQRHGHKHARPPYACAHHNNAHGNNQQRGAQHHPLVESSTATLR